MDDSGDVIDIREPHWLDRPLPACPSCGGTELVAVRDGNDVNFVCQACTRCWHVELGFVHRVDPRTCSGCRFAERCRAVYRTDHR